LGACDGVRIAVRYGENGVATGLHLDLARLALRAIERLQRFVGVIETGQSFPKQIVRERGLRRGVLVAFRNTNPRLPTAQVPDH
jgi:hypothetical protein